MAAIDSQHVVMSAHLDLEMFVHRNTLPEVNAFVCHHG